MMTPNSPLFHDPTLWLVFSFATFVILSFVFGRKIVLGILDSKIEKIRNDISAAEKLHAEAQDLLNKYKSDLQNAAIEADRIIAKAKSQAEDIKAKAESELAASMTRREDMLKNRIDQMERGAMDDIRRYAAELAISATSEIISQKLSASSAEKLADESIRHISEKLN